MEGMKGEPITKWFQDNFCHRNILAITTKLGLFILGTDKFWIVYGEKSFKSYAQLWILAMAECQLNLSHHSVGLGGQALK